MHVSLGLLLLGGLKTWKYNHESEQNEHLYGPLNNTTSYPISADNSLLLFELVCGMNSAQESRTFGTARGTISE